MLVFLPRSLRGYAQRDPLVEYKLEGYNLFVEMMAQVRAEAVPFCISWCNHPPCVGGLVEGAVRAAATAMLLPRRPLRRDAASLKLSPHHLFPGSTVVRCRSAAM